MPATPFDGVGLALSLATLAGQIATVASGWVGGPYAPRGSIAFVGGPRLSSLAGGVVHAGFILFHFVSFVLVPSGLSVRCRVLSLYQGYTY